MTRRRIVKSKETRLSRTVNDLAERYYSSPPRAAERNVCLRNLVSILRTLVHRRVYSLPSNNMTGLTPVDKEELVDDLMTITLSAILDSYRPGKSKFNGYFWTAINRRLIRLVYKRPTQFNVTGGEIRNPTKVRGKYSTRTARHIRRPFTNPVPIDSFVGENSDDESDHRTIGFSRRLMNNVPELYLPERTRDEVNNRIQNDIILGGLSPKFRRIAEEILGGNCGNKKTLYRLMEKNKFTPVEIKKFRSIMVGRLGRINESRLPR